VTLIEILIAYRDAVCENVVYPRRCRWVLMGDLGITWEPASAIPTEELARVDLTQDAQQVAAQLHTTLS
jgi:hypothetical protein